VPYSDAVAPEALKVTIRTSASGLDLTTVTAVTLNVRKPSGTESTWTGAIQSATAATLIVSFVYLPGHLDEVGDYRTKPVLAVPGGSVNCKAFSFSVKDWR